MNAIAARLSPMLFIVVWTALLGSAIALPEVLSLPDRGDFLIRGTVRIALVYWAIAAALLLIAEPRQTPARLTWTLACIAYLIHVGMAFEFAHHWSHVEAFEHVRRAGGVGAGIFVSYFFSLLWTIDAAWWWIDRAGHEQRRRWINWSIHGFMVFVIVNATVIFESGATRWIGAAVLAGLGGKAWHRLRKTTGDGPVPGGLGTQRRLRKYR